ncbi:Potassium voltage-gated channel protein eag (Ether-a-go-go protein) [Durusdinium trenchii]|uniref:Potassium voltage-gated channel protein eag (Ether-a-go-go protein) n=1 Tax=Durusdinium trenchii TaxID=1381693 RepID=A0ABP0RCR8_9DINO
MEKFSVLQLLEQAGRAHETELAALQEANTRLTKELEELLPGPKASASASMEAPPQTPPKLHIAHLIAGPSRLGSRVSFDEGGVAKSISVDQSPSAEHTPRALKSDEEGEEEDASPRPWSVPLPGAVLSAPAAGDADARRASDFSQVVPQAEGESPPRLLSPSRTADTEALARLRNDQLDTQAPLKLALAWRKKNSGTMSKVARTVTSNTQKHLSLHDDDECFLCRILDRLVLDPSSPKRMAFEVFGLVLIVYDLFWLPMQAKPGVYWAVDIPMSLLVGHLSRGIIEMKVRVIARLYLRGWFWFDLTVVSVDWVLNIMEVVNNTKNVGGISALRLGKGVRVLRVFRLIRVLKGGGILQELLDTIHSEHCIIIVGIVKLLALILCVNHIIACLWFWVGSSEHAVNWISEAEILPRTIAYKYATCLHWSLTQFTPASMEVYPTNEEERTFTVCVIVSAMVIFSSFISAITNAMTQLRNLNKEKIEQFSLLRKYLTQCNVSGGLLARVLQSMSSAMNKNKRRVHEEDIKVLHLLPLSLRQDMNQEVYSPHFVVHPFFSVCASCFDTYVRKLYSAGLRTKFVPSNQEIITSGEQAKEMFFIITGSMNYKSDRQLSPLPVTIQEGTWLAEASLWLQWQHNGLGNTVTECDVLVLDAAKFQEIFKDDVMVKHYAVAFWEHFMSNPADLTDAWADEDLLFQWSTEALQTAEQCMGSVIEPDHRNTAFSRHVTQKRRSSSAMLDETILKDYPRAHSADAVEMSP